MHSQITYNHSIWQEKDWIVTRFRKSLVRKFVPEKREEANKAMKNQRRDLLGLRVCWLFPNRHWRDLSLPTDRRGHGVFFPRLAGWYELYPTLLFVVGSDWGPLSGSQQGGRELTMMSVGGYNRGRLGGARQGITSSPPCCTNPSSMDFWLGFFYNFYITKIFVIVVIRGRSNEFLVAIVCIAIFPAVLSVNFSEDNAVYLLAGLDNTVDYKIWYILNPFQICSCSGFVLPFFCCTYINQKLY